MLKLVSSSCGSGRVIKLSSALLLGKRHTQTAQTQCFATTTLRTATSATTPTPTPDVGEHKSWHTIYRLPLVRWAASFNRLKIYQGTFTMLGFPMAMVLEQTGQIPLHTTAIFGALGGSMLLTLAICSVALQNLIGFIYVNNEGNQLKIAYVDYWGRRRETVVATDDIKPLWENVSPMRFDVYKNVCLHSDPKRAYKLLNNYGIIVEPHIYGEIFSS